MPETKPRLIRKQRRLSPELRAEIMQQLKNGERPHNIERQYQLCFNTVAKLRRLIGDVPGRPGRKRKLSKAVLASAEQRLRRGEKLCVVAADCGVHQHTLHNCMRFRKRAKR
jgi:transposase-like protein